MADRESENVERAERDKISSNSLAALSDHHVIIATQNGTLYKVRQKDLPKIGEPIPEGEAVLDFARKTPGGMIDFSSEGASSYYALNCTAFTNIPPAAYEFSEVEIPEPDSDQPPDFPIVVIPMPDPAIVREEGRRPEESDKIAYLIDPDRLQGLEWRLGGGELLDNARTFVKSAIRHGMAVGLFPAVNLPDEEDFIFCYCINCRAFQEFAGERPRTDADT